MNNPKTHSINNIGKKTQNGKIHIKLKRWDTRTQKQKKWERGMWVRCWRMV